MKRTSVFMVTETPKPDRSLELARHDCKSCKNSTVVQASMDDPFCAHCGSGDMAPAEAAGLRARSLLRADDSEMSSARCPNSECRSYSIMTKETARVHSDADGIGHLHCAACATPFSYRAPEAAAVSDDEWAEDPDADESLNDDTKLADDAGGDSSSDGGDMPTVVVFDVNGEEIARGTLNERDDLVFVLDVAGDDDETSMQSFTVGSANDVVEDEDGNIELNDAELIDSVAEDEVEDSAKEAEDDELDVDGDPQADEGPANDTEEAAAGDDEDEPEEAAKADDESATGEPVADTEVAHVTATPVTVALHRLVPGDAEFASYGDLTVCRRGDVVVASVEQTEANSGSFAKALNTAIANPENTLDAVLASNGFTVSEVTLTEDAHIAERVRVATESATEVVQASMEDSGDRLKQSVGIALTAMNRGMLNATNPFLGAVTAGLIEAGADEETANAVVSAALAGAGDEFATVLQEQVLKVYAKSDELRNELASTLGEFQINTETASVVTRKSRLAAELETPMRGSPETASTHNPKAPAKGSRIAELASASAFSLSK